VNLMDVVIGGGQLRVRLPAEWKESVEEDGSTAYYDVAPDGGTLRVKVMTFTSEEDLSKRTAREQLEDMEPEPEQTIDTLPNGNAVRVHRETGDDDGQPTEFRVWLLASVDPPHRLHLAIFTFTVLSKNAEKANAVIASLNVELKDASFAHQVS
jgi:hypothetical protein